MRASTRAHDDARPDPFVTEIIAHMATYAADTRAIEHSGRPGSRAQHLKSLERYKYLVWKLLLNCPREGKESPKVWHSRVVGNSPRREDGATLGMAGRLHAIINRMDREAEDETKRREAASAAREEAELAEHRRAAMPDAAELAQLMRTIEEAAEGERLLPQMLAAHRRAQAARRRISSLFESARNARHWLRAYGEVVSKPLPMQPAVCEAPEGAVALAALIDQAIALRRNP